MLSVNPRLVGYQSQLSGSFRYFARCATTSALTCARSSCGILMVALVLEGLYRFVLTVVVCAATPVLGGAVCCDCCDCNGDADTALLQPMALRCFDIVGFVMLYSRWLLQIKNSEFNRDSSAHRRLRAGTTWSRAAVLQLDSTYRQVATTGLAVSAKTH